MLFSFFLKAEENNFALLGMAVPVAIEANTIVSTNQRKMEVQADYTNEFKFQQVVMNSSFKDQDREQRLGRLFHNLTVSGK